VHDLSDVDSAYPGDDAGKARIAAWMGAEAQRRGLPPELPVMAGLVESNLSNLPGGDADSVGYFQMRVGIWNNGQYAGYPDHPKRQLDWFLDQAAAVKKQRIAAGRSVMDPNQYGEWTADVERPAAQYRGRYQLQIEEARRYLAKGVPKSDSPGADDVPVDGGGGNDSALKAMLARAEKVEGRHPVYLWGGGHGAEPAPLGEPVDCSGFVAQILNVTPRVSGQFAQFGEPGAGRQVTIYANSEHVLIKVGSRWYGTSHSNPGGGAGRIAPPSEAYLAAFVKRHPAGM
jgi:hypothetical protein